MSAIGAPFSWSPATLEDWNGLTMEQRRKCGWRHLKNIPEFERFSEDGQHMPPGPEEELANREALAAQATYGEFNVAIGAPVPPSPWRIGIYVKEAEAAKRSAS